ncbi:MAG: hypothetical protein R3E89_02710 [Thiolinea sp.]
MNKSFILMVFLGLSACVAPREPRYEFIPPATQAGQSCVQSCAVQNNSCKQRVQALANQCAVRARQQALREMPGRVGAYEAALDDWERRIRRYEREMSLYELQMRHYRMMHDLSYERHCRDKDSGRLRDCRRDYPRWRGGFWLDEPHYPGRAPRRPTLESVTAERVREQAGRAISVRWNTASVTPAVAGP